MTTKFNDSKNFTGQLIKVAREKKHLKKSSLCQQLELLRSPYQWETATTNGRMQSINKRFRANSHLQNTRYRPKQTKRLFR